jgi:tetratricopeptide (TPR) repeat protein
LKKQLFTAGIALLIVIALFVFGRTIPDKSIMAAGSNGQTAIKNFSITDFIAQTKKKLSPAQGISLSKLENNITRGDVPAQKIVSYYRLASFWKDSVKTFEPYAYYISEASKLDNSEKNLTFAAQLFLDNLRKEPDEAVLGWKTGEAIALFEQALKLNPENEDLKIGLGSAYIFGNGRNGNPEETMKGIQTLLSVVKKDSTNMKAQLVLGIGGVVSGQYDKAVERLLKVVSVQPGNMEAVAFLADAYAAKKDKPNAIKWYTINKQMVNDAEYSREVDERIKQMK